MLAVTTCRNRTNCKPVFTDIKIAVKMLAVVLLHNATYCKTIFESKIDITKS